MYHSAGAKLSTQTQANLYRLLTECKKPTRSKNTNENISKVKCDLKLKYTNAPTTETIWSNLKKNKNITRKTREFFYCAIRGTYRIRKFWEHTNKNNELSDNGTSC
jgi:hypothetical protein